MHPSPNATAAQLSEQILEQDEKPLHNPITPSIDALMHELTPRQTTYVKRLSQVTGREIVPIDLDLYRELLKLGLIVDKGRRLALSKLGKEVAAALV